MRKNLEKDYAHGLVMEELRLHGTARVDGSVQPVASAADFFDFPTHVSATFDDSLRASPMI